MTEAKCTKYNDEERLFFTFKLHFNCLYQSVVVKWNNDSNTLAINMKKALASLLHRTEGLLKESSKW